MDGALVGRDSIIGANALVTRNKVFPPRSVIAGSPAKRVREATDAEVEFIQYSADKYAKVMRDHLYLQRNPNE
jgi:carbonic anhydrase/acetyltransferase-like protein (isoleucine patch superfamily)